MVSAVFIGIFLLADFAVLAWIVAWLARIAGSTRATFARGLICILALFAMSLPFAAVNVWSNNHLQYPLPMFIITALLNLIAGYYFVKWWFGVPKRAYIPYVGMNVAGIILAVVLVLPLRFFLCEAFVLPTQSMVPTLNPADRFMVNKRLHPRRWDLVAYENRDPTGARAPVVYCKRLIALPGERLRFQDGTIFINEQPTAVPAVLAGKCHAGYAAASNSMYADGETITLGPDEFFFVGDNIAISADSRIYGPSHADAIVGVVDAVYWPMSAARIVR